MICTDRRLRLCIALIAANLVFIWGNSMLPAAVSQALSDFVKSLLPGRLPITGEEAETSSFIIRKLAHFTEFSTLGALLAWLAGMLGKKKWMPLGWGVAAACLDETIQCFVPERGPGLRDVAIDGCGVLLGIVLLTLGHRYISNVRIKTRTMEELQ